MSLLAGLSLKTLAGAGSAAVVVGGGGTVAYLYQDSISDFINHNVLNKVKKHQYIVATITTVPQGTKDLYTGDQKTFNCSITIDGTTTNDSYCEIFKLSKETTSTDTIATQDIGSTTEIKAKSNLTTNKQVLVKLSDSFKAKLTSENSTFQLLSNSGKKIADLKWEFDLNRNHQNTKTPITESSLMVIKLSEAPTHASANATDNTYTCLIGSDTTGIPCKVYKFANSSTTFSSDNLKTISAIGTSDSTIVKDHFLVVDLLEAKKSFADLDGKTIEIKNSNTKVASGVLDNLLVGKIDKTGAASVLLKLSDKETRSVVNTTGTKNHILTKFASKHVAPSSTFPTDLICRFVDDKTIYEDETCALYKFGDTSKTTFDIADFKTEGQKITADTDITSDKYQVVHISQKIIDKLSTSSTTKKLEIVEKSKKTKAFNNQYVSLEVKGLLSSGDETTQTLHSNLFAARVTAAGTGSGSAEVVTGLKCNIDDVEFDCKIYKQASDAVGNAIGSTNLTSISDSLTPTTDLALNKYVVVELTSSQKTLSDLKNKTVVVTKSDKTAYVTLAFDQQLFGYTDTGTKYVVPLKSKEVSFIVTKGTKASGATWESQTIAATARCRLAKTDSSSELDNYDYSCKLMKFTTPSDGKKVSTLTELKNLSAPGTPDLTLDTNTEGFYKLIFDVNKLYNLDLESFANKPISIELAPTSPEGETKIYGVVELKQDITGTTAKGKTDLLLGKVSVESTAQTVTGSKCKFSEGDEGFDCTLYKDSSSDSTKDKVVFGNAISAPETFTTGKFYAIKLGAPKDLSELSNKSLIYFEQGAGDTAGKKVTFTIEHIMGGDVSSGKKLYFLNEAAAAQ